MSQLRNFIIWEALAWLDRQCSESDAACMNEMNAEFIRLSGQAATTREAWCAKFTTIIVGRAAIAAGLSSNPHPSTKGARATLDLTAKARTVPIDKKPEPGDVFYRFSNAAGASGHVGIVVGVDSDQITTIEGNTNDRVMAVRYTMDTVRKASNGFQFMHYGRIAVPKTWSGKDLNLIPMFIRLENQARNNAAKAAEIFGISRPAIGTLFLLAAAGYIYYQGVTT